MSKEEKRKILLTRGLMLLGAAVVTFLIISSWQEEEVVPDSPAVQKSEKSTGFFSRIFSDKKRTSQRRVQTSDPRLKDVALQEIPYEDPHAEPKDPEKKRLNRLTSIMSEPLPLIMEKYLSFRITGEMDVTLPIPSDKEEDYKKGRRFNRSENLSSKFTFIKDQYGYFMLKQETRCSRKKTSYNDFLYNSTLYFYRGKYYLYSLEGKRLNNDKAKAYISRFGENRREPLVRRNWIQTVRDIKLVISFTEGKKNNREESWSIDEANHDTQHRTMELRNFSGEITVDLDYKTMSAGELRGKAKHMMGYIKGADTNFSFRLEMHDIDDVTPLALPDEG